MPIYDLECPKCHTVEEHIISPHQYISLKFKDISIKCTLCKENLTPKASSCKVIIPKQHRAAG